MTKQSSLKVIFGIGIDTYRGCIKYQSSPEMNWSNIEIDHKRLISSFDISNNEELKEAFSWENTRPLLSQDHQQKIVNNKEDN